MDVPSVLRDARRRSGLTQADLGAATGTSQATISAYERGRKTPSLDTLERLLAATGARLQVAPAPTAPPPEALAQTARALHDVLRLAAALPTRHERELRYPRLPGG